MYEPNPDTMTSLAHLNQRTERDYSNNVLVSNDGTVYFLPAYLRVIFMEVEDISLK